MNYGRQITRLGWLDLLGGLKQRLIVRIQYPFIRWFGALPFPSRTGMLVSRVARSLIGGYIYSIKLEVNDYCNLRCKMCYVDKMKHDLPDKHIYKLLDSMRGQGIRLEILGGEPLMREDILDIIRYAKEMARVPFISLYTNGTRATREMALGLKKAGLDAILVTLISNREKVHDEFTGIPGSWQETTAGIRRLVKAGIETYSFTTVHSYNHKQYRDIHNFVKQELKAHALFYQYIPQQKADPLLISAIDWHQIKQWILLEENVAHAGFVRDFYTISGNACSGGNFVFTVKVDGSVQPCPFIHNIPLGNIKENSIWSIFRKRFSKPELVEFKSTPEECLECAYRSICGGGCKAGNDVFSGSYNCKDLRCLGPFTKVRPKEEVMADLPTFF